MCKKKKKSSKLPLTLTCCLFFLFCLFFLLYLKLQRSDDDAENALWVCSSAGAAQRHHPSEWNGGKRVRAIPTPLTPFGLLVVDPPLNQPRSRRPPQKISDNIGFSKKKTIHFDECVYFMEKWSSIGYWLLISKHPLSPCSHRLHFPLKSPPLWDRSGGSSVSQSGAAWWMLVCSCLTWPLKRRASEETGDLARRKVTQAALWCIEVTVSAETRAARSRLLRLHYRGRYSHGMSGILGWERRWDAARTFDFKLESIYYTGSTNWTALVLWISFNCSWLRSVHLKFSISIWLSSDGKDFLLPF